MTSLSHSGGTLRLSPRPQTPKPPATAPKVTPADLAAKQKAAKKLLAQQRHEAELRRRQQGKATRRLLRERWPALFIDSVPLAIGITRAIRAELGAGVVSSAALSSAMNHWTRRSVYLEAIAAGEMRRNLDGTDAGVPEPSHRQSASEALEQRKLWREPKQDGSDPG